MKTFTFIMLILVISLSSLAQGYQKLIRDSVYWDIAEADHTYICSNFSEYEPNRFFFNGDTTIAGHTYAKVYHYNIFPTAAPPTPNCPPFAVDTVAHLSTSYFIREDTLARKVFRSDINTGEDFLLFDFSVQQGDSILNPYSNLNHNIDTVYTIFTDDGIEHNKFIIGSRNEWPESYYIEGIGGVHGIFGPPFLYLGLGNDGPWIMCIRTFDNSAIMSSNYCYDFITGISNSSTLPVEVHLSPVPANDKINIRLTTPRQAGNYVFELFQITGKSILAQLLNNSQSEINIDDLPAGFYIYTIKAKNGILKTGKLIIK